MKKSKKQIPIVQITGLLSFSGLTLLGVLSGLPPDVVLTRVSIGTGLVMLTTGLAIKLLGLLPV